VTSPADARPGWKDLYQDLVETAQDLVWQCDQAGRYVYLNPAWEETLGYPLDSMLGHRFSEFQPADEAARDGAVFTGLLAGTLIKGHETIHLRQDGRPVHLVFNAKPVLDAQGRVVGTRGTAWDVTDRQWLVNALHASHERFRRLYQDMPLPLVLVDPSFRFTEANPAFQAMLGYGMDELRHMTFAELTHPEDRAQDVEQVKRVRSGELPMYRRTKRYVAKSGEVVWGVVTVTRVLDAQGAFQGFLVMIHDVTELKRTEQALRKSELFLNESQCAARIGSYEYDIPAGTWTSSACLDEIFGIDASYTRDVTGWLALIHPEDRPEMTRYLAEEVLGRKTHFDREYRLARGADAHGEAVWVHGTGVLHLDAAGQPARLLGIIQDVTRHRRTEQAIQRTAHLESLGVLAGGIAHDFNNLLGGLFGLMELASMESSEPAVRETLAEAQKVHGRARDLTRQLLTFAKGGAPSRRVASLAPVLRNAARFALSGANVQCRFSLPEDLFPCEHDENQVAQVIDNLVINAVQAMPSGGWLDLGAENVTFEDGGHPTLRPGRYVHAWVRDQGTGIPPDVLPRVFDPFFTTKPQGSGLGLTVAHSIARRHGGALDVDTQPDKGSTFHLFLPAAVDGTPAPPPPVALDHAGSGTVLLLEDEESLRRVVSRTLARMGYTVLEASNAADAWDHADRARAQGHPLALAILDLTIPGGPGGRDVAQRLRAQGDTFPIFACSGYSDDPVMAEPARFGFTASMDKPFTREALASLLSRHLGR
jgi:PAS domain S-box-containing protein